MSWSVWGQSSSPFYCSRRGSSGERHFTNRPACSGLCCSRFHFHSSPTLLDGFDLGAGAVHLFVAKTDAERRQVIRSIGPVWDGNEVWLIAAGGTLYFAFPLLYASSFSGFYLPLMIVLWLFVLRGVSVEFRTHVESPFLAGCWGGVF